LASPPPRHRGSCRRRAPAPRREATLLPRSPQLSRCVMNRPALAISAERLTKRYGETLAVAGVDLAIAPGRFFGLLGPNGAGKTSTIHMLSTLIRPTSGSASVHGHDVLRESVQTRASIGLVFQ